MKSTTPLAHFLGCFGITIAKTHAEVHVNATFTYHLFCYTNESATGLFAQKQKDDLNKPHRLSKDENIHFHIYETDVLALEAHETHKERLRQQNMLFPHYVM